MKELKYEDAVDLSKTYMKKDKIQVLCFITKESDCIFCNELLNGNSVLEVCEKDGLVELYTIEMTEAYGHFVPPYSFQMNIYVPWMQNKSPMVRWHPVPYAEMSNEFLRYIERKSV